MIVARRSARPEARAILASLLLVPALLSSPSLEAKDVQQREVPQKKLLHKKESVYNTILVFQEGLYRTLKFGFKKRHYWETVYNPTDPTQLPSEYTQYMTTAIAYADKLKRAVVIGMGGGRATWYLAHYLPDMQVTGVELDPEIVRIAGEYFDVHEGPNLKIVTRDGRVFMRRTKERYDYIVVDAYRGAFVPFHLLTHEFYQLLEDRLEPGGVVVQNIAPRTMLFDYALATIASVFDNVDLYKANSNIVAIAYNGPRKTVEELSETGLKRQRALGLRYGLAKMVQQRMLEQTPDPKKVLTDDFAPANYLKAVEAHNRKWDK